MTQLLLPDIKGYSTEDLMEELRRRGIDVNLIEHHNKYLEIDGVDETVWVTHKQHREIHKQWRKEGRIIPTEICKKAGSRTKRHSEYNKEYRKRISFFETILPKVALLEIITYNKKTGDVYYASDFKGNNYKQLYYLKE